MSSDGLQWGWKSVNPKATETPEAEPEEILGKFGDYEIIEKIAFGAATKANDFHLSPAQPYWPDDIEQREYDPDQAKSLLKKGNQRRLTSRVRML